MHTESNYPELPFDIVLELVSKQSLTELMSSRLLSSQWRIAADCALFSRQDKLAIEHQERLLQLWSNKTPAEMSALFSEGQGLFKRHLLASMQSPSSNHYYRLSGLRVLGAMNHCPVSISPAVINGLLNKLNHEDWTVRQIALKALPPLATLMSETQIKVFIPQVAQKLYDSDSAIRIFAVQAFWSIASLMTENQRANSITQVTRQLGNECRYARKVALDTLGSIAMLMTKDERATVITQVMDKLNDEEWDVRQSALNALPSIASLMARDERKTIITQIRDKLNDKNWSARLDALNALWLIASLITEEQRQLLITQVEGKLNDSECEVRRAALDTYLAIIDKNDSVQVAAFIAKVMEKLNGSDSYFRVDALTALSAIANLMSDDERAIIISKLNITSAYDYLAFIDKNNSTQVTTFITWAKGKLNDSDYYVCEDSLKALLSIASLMTEEQRAEFINQVTEKLYTQDWRMQEAALIVLSSIASLMTEAQRANLITSFASKLNNQEWRSSTAALRGLSFIARFMNEAQQIRIITLITNKLNDLNADIRITALGALALIADLMTKEQCATFITQAQWKHDSSEEVHIAALQALCTIASSVTEASTDQKLNEIANEALNDPNWRIREHALNLVSTLLVLGKYQSINVEQLADPSVESLVLESLLQVYSRDAVYGKLEPLEPGEQLSTNKAANAAVVADEPQANSGQSAGTPRLNIANAGQSGLLNSVGFFRVGEIQAFEPEITPYNDYGA